MRIIETSVRKMVITDVKGLDTINVFLEDFGPEKGKVTIEVFGESWAHYWPAMGERDIIKFISSSDDEYLIKKLGGPSFRENEPDYDKLSQDTGCNIFDEESTIAHSDAMVGAYGSDWMIDYPKCRTPEYEYLRKIVQAVKEACKKVASSQEF